MTKFLVIAVATLGFLTAAAPSQAQTYYDYPWCAAYSFWTKNCGFMTFQQCLATISGVGGSCEPNPFYRPRPAKSKRRKANRG